jgi:hypothetical protein
MSRQFPEQKVLSMTLHCTTARIARRSVAKRDERVPGDQQTIASPGREAIVAVLPL